MGRDLALERRRRAAAVLGARRRRERSEPEVETAAPVAADRPERGETRLPAVGCDADAVDPGPADDGHSPAALGARTEDGEGVVADAESCRPAALPGRGTERLLLRREVDAREQELGDLGEGGRVPVEARVRGGLVEEVVDHRDAAVEAEVVRRAERPARDGEQGAVSAHERDVGLGVAAVDREHDGHRTVSSTARRSSSSSVSSYCPISGWARSAFFAVTGSRVAGRLGGQALVGGHVLDEPEQLGRERRFGQRLDPGARHPGRDLDDVVCRQPGECRSIAQVDLVDAVLDAGQRCDETRRRLAVERATALLELCRLLAERRIAVELQQLALELGDDGRARHAVELLGEHAVVLVEVVEVVGGNDAELLEEPPREADLCGELVGVLGKEIREDVVTVEPHGADPGEVVQPDLVDRQPGGIHAEQPGVQALLRDRDVAEPDCPVPLVEERPGDDADRVGEVDDPGAVGGELARAAGDLQHDRHRPHRLGEAARAGRLLADAAAGEGGGLVEESRRLAADPDLDEDEVRSVERPVELLGQRQRAPVALALEHPRGQRADHVEALGVDVVQGEVGVPEPRERRHELGRVGGPGADHRELHPFTPVSVTPSTNTFCARKKMTITGAITSRVAAIVRFHCTWWRERNSERPIESTQWLDASPT